MAEGYCQYRYPQREGLGNYAGTLCEKDAFAFEHNPNDHLTCTGQDGEACMYHPYQPEPAMTIYLTPTDEAFATTACLFVQNVLGDVKASRKNASKEMLEEVVKIAFMLGQKGREDQAVRIIKAIR